MFSSDTISAHNNTPPPLPRSEATPAPLGGATPAAPLGGATPAAPLGGATPLKQLRLRVLKRPRRLLYHQRFRHKHRHSVEEFHLR
jgi:hypothetical protein